MLTAIFLAAITLALVLCFQQFIFSEHAVARTSVCRL